MLLCPNSCQKRILNKARTGKSRETYLHKYRGSPLAMKTKRGYVRPLGRSRGKTKEKKRKELRAHREARNCPRIGKRKVNVVVVGKRMIPVRFRRMHAAATSNRQKPHHQVDCVGSGNASSPLRQVRRKELRTSKSSEHWESGSQKRVGENFI